MRSTVASTFRPQQAGGLDLSTRLALAGGLTAALAAWLVVQGGAKYAAVAFVALGAIALVVARPEWALMAWFCGILIDGRSLTYHKAGPLYVTEPLLAILAFGLFIRFLAGARDPAPEAHRRDAFRFVGLLALVMFVPAFIGLATRTSSMDYATARNFVLILYVVFGLITVAVTDLRNSYRAWFWVVLVGCTIALLVAATGHAGQEEATSTGAVRLAAHTFALAFGIAPIVLIAGAREGFIKAQYAIAGCIPFLLALVFVNHRSAWLAFFAAALILFGKRLSAPVVIGGIAVLAVGYGLFTYGHNNVSTVGQEVTRAKTVFSTDDPNARFRLSFWDVAMRKSINSPLIGAGFDPYPASIVPPETVGEDPFPAPHNSFVAIAYRIGFIPFLIVLLMLGTLVFRGFRASIERAHAIDRAVCSALTAIVAYAGITSAFNVFLEAPYAGPLFWTAVALLAYAVYARPWDTSDEAEAPA